MNTPTDTTASAPLDYAHDKAISQQKETTVQEVDVMLLWIFAILAFVMSLLFVAAIPLCVIALFRGADVVVIISLICATGMSVGLIGTGVGLIRRARRGRNLN